MNTFFFRICCLGILSLLLGFSQCKKSYSPTNEILYDKSLDEIKAHITGDWTLIYGKGGICGICVQTYSDDFWKITANDSVRIWGSQSQKANTKINWVKEPGTFTNGDSTYEMQFNDLQGYPFRYVVDRIENDTLILHDNSADAVFYHFVRR
ncbi:MAG TPA: hypothetical protein VFE54_11125 [Mucilaginibacter sp.]|nr:hypothetical protein [Mucilaginibacter sp.]